jgi:hypothetical protein
VISRLFVCKSQGQPQSKTNHITDLDFRDPSKQSKSRKYAYATFQANWNSCQRKLSKFNRKCSKNVSRGSSAKVHAISLAIIEGPIIANDLCREARVETRQSGEVKFGADETAGLTCHCLTNYVLYKWVNKMSLSSQKLFHLSAVFKSFV